MNIMKDTETYKYNKIQITETIIRIDDKTI